METAQRDINITVTKETRGKKHVFFEAGRKISVISRCQRKPTATE